MFRKFFVALLAVFAIAGLTACSSGDNADEQKANIAELQKRGFGDPVYTNGYYYVTVDQCRLTLQVRHGSWQWLVVNDHNAMVNDDVVVTGDHRLNAAWLRQNPTGRGDGGYSNPNSEVYNLTPCLDLE